MDRVHNVVHRRSLDIVFCRIEYILPMPVFDIPSLSVSEYNDGTSVELGDTAIPYVLVVDANNKTSILKGDAVNASAPAMVIMCSQVNGFLFSSAQVTYGSAGDENYAAMTRQDFDDNKAEDGYYYFRYQLYLNYTDSSPVTTIEWKQTSNPHDPVAGFVSITEPDLDYPLTGMTYTNNFSLFQITSSSSWFNKVGYFNRHGGITRYAVKLRGIEYNSEKAVLYMYKPI